MWEKRKESVRIVTTRNYLEDVEMESCKMYSDLQLNIPTSNCVGSKHSLTCIKSCHC